MLNALKHENESVREDVVEVLGKLGNGAAIPALINALNDESFDVREEAAEALGKLRATDAIPALRKAIMDENHYARDKAVEALGNLGGEPEIPFLISLLKKDENSGDRSQFSIESSNSSDITNKLNYRFSVPTIDRLVSPFYCLRWFIVHLQYFSPR